MASRIIGDERFQGSLIGVCRRVAVGAFVVALVSTLSACSARYKLVDAELARPRAADDLASLYPLVSNRMIVTYDRSGARETQAGRTIKDRSVGRQLKRVLNRNRRGLIIEETVRNGAPMLWVTFEPRKCTTRSCAFGFVRTDDGRYRLALLPKQEGFSTPKVYRGIVSERRQLKLGKLRSLADANAVYRLERKKKAKRQPTIFLELKKEIRKAKTTETEVIDGR